jgi:hypothetical protein
VAYTTAEGRQDILERLAEAIGAIGSALAALGVAYEAVDEQAGDRLEETLFGPVQRAYGRAQRTHASFAGRFDLPGEEFEARILGAHEAASGPRALIDGALADVTRADSVIADLQDSMLPIEVGDQELRGGLSEVRELLGPLPGRARELTRTLGR